MRISFSFLVLITCICNAEFDLRTVYQQRNQQYCSPIYTHFIIDSPARCGSTAIYNIIKYEYFLENFDLVINAIEKKTAILVKEKDKQAINHYFSKQNVIDFYSKKLHFNNFNQYDPITNFHGNHIDTNQDGISQEFKAKICEYIKQESLPHKEVFIKLGYNIE